ncbi:uncharacterized protein CYBJADRAFT_169762 [Cyberlindnera jadinii NRRL Y-1542]|uniref:Uncharacterized protein n=1 Tax=Cyberlindnera jadinii (strain ATCC 18201 / CBS 1600 / BCRC 20928 / JCM 3617 / NBRC 0987 / NRRL Y-1542) TaxID=983966 RepID=A0A1E4RUR4_CYBJN|nr:hypothetical protein CYBJADRAFT_169762 [Cyberlindnera jadinii NRRL Y-1542]ODV71012.1 hypothetical protein CYBJADRAFT_169762 [Cyberlindnera jadinii NRRL Y-1542]
MYLSRNPTSMKEICQKWEAITGDSKVRKTLEIKLRSLVHQATKDPDMRLNSSCCCVTESSKCETNVFTLEMPFLIGPEANKEIIDTKKLTFAHISEDIVAYLKRRFPRQLVKSCSSPSESIVPATLSVLERIMGDQNIEKVYGIWSSGLPKPGKELSVSLYDLLWRKSGYDSVFEKSACVIRSFEGDEEHSRYKLAFILQFFDMKWHNKALSRASLIKTMRRRHITSALAFVSDLDIERIHAMPSSLVVSDNGTEEEAGEESPSAIGLKISAKAKMTLCPLLLDYIDEDDPRSSWFSDSPASKDCLFDPSKNSALISLSNVIVGKAELLFRGESEPMNPKSGSIQIQMSNFNQCEFMAHNEL